jgi:hypothetical protein
MSSPLALGPLFRRVGLGLAVAVVVCWSWALAATLARANAIYQATGQASPLLQGAVQSLGQPLPGIFLRGVGGALRPLGNFTWGSGANTLCELYVEQTTGIGNQGVTADAAAQRLASQGLMHQGTPPVGALVYFGPSPDNEFDGHVGIALGGGQFRSITALGLADAPLAGWQAPFLGWVNPASITTDRFGNAVHPTANTNA